MLWVWSAHRCAAAEIRDGHPAPIRHPKPGLERRIPEQDRGETTLVLQPLEVLEVEPDHRGRRAADSMATSSRCPKTRLMTAIPFVYVGFASCLRLVSRRSVDEAVVSALHRVGVRP